MNVLVIDIGGTNVKMLATGQKERCPFASGPNMTPQRMVAGVKQLAADWKYDVAADSPLFGDGVTQPVAAAERFTRRCEPACRGILSPCRRPTFPRVL